MRRTYSSKDLVEAIADTFEAQERLKDNNKDCCLALYYIEWDHTYRMGEPIRREEKYILTKDDLLLLKEAHYDLYKEQKIEDLKWSIEVTERELKEKSKKLKKLEENG